MANNICLHSFPDPVGHFGAPWRPFWIFGVLIEGMMESKNLFSESCSEWPITYVYTPFQTPSAILWPPGGHLWFFEGQHTVLRATLQDTLAKFSPVQRLQNVCRFWASCSHFGIRGQNTKCYLSLGEPDLNTSLFLYHTHWGQMTEH